MVGRRRIGGFTLLEVLVAFAVLAVSLGVAFEIFSTGMRNSRAADAYSRATLHAESTLERVASEAPLTAGEDTGEFGDGFAWRAVVRPYPIEGVDGDAEGAARAMEVVVSVAWQDGQRQRSITLATLRLGHAPQ